MAVSKALRRLLSIRGILEERARLKLEASLSQVRFLEHSLQVAGERDRSGRRAIVDSVVQGEEVGRLAGNIEIQLAERDSKLLQPRIASAQLEAAELRLEFQARRIERRQTDIVVENEEKASIVESERRYQQSLDDWHGSRAAQHSSKDRL